MSNIHNKVEVAVIPVAGIGSRMLPLTSFLSKSLLPIGIYPTIYYLLKELRETEIKEIHFVCNEHISEIFNFLNPKKEYANLRRKNQEYLRYMLEIAELKNAFNFHFHYQDDESEGLGGAIFSLSKIINGPFLLLLGDDIHDSSSTIRKMLYFYEMFKKSAFIFSVEELDSVESQFYGSISYKRSPVSSLLSVNNLYEKTISNEQKKFWAINGRYILDETIFYYLAKLAATRESSEHEVELTDAINLAVKENQLVYAFKSLSNRYDIGRKHGYYKAFIKEALVEDPSLIQWISQTLNVKNMEK